MTHEPTVEEEMQRCQHSALHLEMRDSYTQNDPMLEAWRQGHRQDLPTLIPFGGLGSAS